ncbi:helix-turn-helix transcriptional regulator [Peptoniphilus asaccharolyticus]
MPLLNKLKELRSEKGLNQQELGSLVGVSRQTISLIERGDYNPSITVCLKLSKVLEVSIEEIFLYEEEE